MPLCVLGGHGRGGNGEPLQREAEVGLLCIWHARQLEEWLRDIEIDYALLDDRIAPMRSSSDFNDAGHSGGGDESRAPINLHVAALRDAERGGPADTKDDIPSVIAVLHGRAEDLRCELDPSRDHNSSVKDWTVVGEVRYLLVAFNHLTATIWIDEAFNEIKRVWKALQAAHGRRAPRPLGPCLSVDCDGKVWPRQDASPRCGVCRREYDTKAEIIKVGLEAERAKAARTA